MTHNTTHALASTGSLLMVLIAALLSACVSTPKLSPQQCQQGDWQHIGETDGAAGRSAAYFGKHLSACQGVLGSMPNREMWEQGRQTGLTSYCTELNAYKLGREGRDWQPICPLQNIDKLEEAYRQGRYHYLRQRDMDYLAYPWGYGGYGRWGWYDPFWRPVW